MSQKLNGSGRRVLTFPAVHPCESISPSTLLNSLIDLAHDICAYKSEFFSSNKRNAHETIRQVQNLLIFLEEIRVGLVDVPGSLVVGLSELHLAFQRIQYLLEDCTREGARLWVLMKSDRVANQFQVLIRAIGTGLDVLPLEVVDVCVSTEVNELLELVNRQARKAIIEIDPDDKRVLNDVIRILGRFEEGIDPDKSEVKRVLDYLGIQKWSRCNKEVNFLDSEIGIEYLNVDKRRELALLSSLMGFLSYCRCVMFDHVDNEASQQVNSKCCNNMLSGLTPEDFRCPISLEIMKDPVTLSTGHTYDRASILKWFGAGNSTCPKTGERLHSKELVANLVLKRIIQDWSVDNGVSITEKSSHKNRDITRTVLAGSLEAEGAVKLLANFLANRLVDGTSEEMNKAAYEIRILTKTSIFNRSCLVEAGCIPSLLNLLASKDSLTQENATAALLNLSKHCKSKSMIVENGGLELIVDVLKKGLKVESRHHAAATLFYIASIEEYRKLIGENPEAIPALVDMVRDGTDRGKKNALVAIFGLLMHSGNHWRVLAAGAIPLLLNLLNSSDREELVTDSLAVLATLAENLEGTIAILRRRALNMIMKILDSCTSKAGKEYCVSLLLALCINGGANVVALLVKSPSLMGSLYFLLSEGTSRGSKKASALIRILHEFYERSSSGSTTPLLPQDRSVHVW